MKNEKVNGGEARGYDIVVQGRARARGVIIKKFFFTLPRGDLPHKLFLASLDSTTTSAVVESGAEAEGIGVAPPHC
eukprot:scaffold309958_cov32-Tisochrysis_lutea.AAC.2